MRSSFIGWVLLCIVAAVVADAHGQSIRKSAVGAGFSLAANDRDLFDAKKGHKCHFATCPDADKRRR
jgi:hypothetical protein